MAGFLEQYRHLEPFAHEAQEHILRQFEQDPNVVGAGYGQRTKDGADTYEPAVVVYVIEKQPTGSLRGTAPLPRSVTVRGEEVQVDVVQTGRPYAHMYTARERPAQGGISVGNESCGCAGTFGCIVQDAASGPTMMLSNNHVLARENRAARGEGI